MPTDFVVKYDGPALDAGRMSVSDLAPSLLALGELLQEINSIVQPTAQPLTLEIKATEKGSFDVHLGVVGGAVNTAVDLFSSDTAVAVEVFSVIVLAPMFALLRLIKRLRNRAVVTTEPSPQVEGSIRLTLDDHTTIEVPVQVLELYRSVTVRRSVRKVVRPLETPGIDVVEFQEESEVRVSVNADEIDAFDVPAVVDRQLVDNANEMVVSIAAVAFTEGNKWRLSDGDHTFFATVRDQRFLARIDSGQEAFRKGDLLRCEMRTVQHLGEDGIRTDHEVISVIEHIPRSIQIPLPLDDDGAAE